MIKKLMVYLLPAFFLKLPKYYISQYSITRINLKHFCYKSVLLFFKEKADPDFFDQLVPFD